jgi:hypothetical protein
MNVHVVLLRVDKSVYQVKCRSLHEEKCVVGVRDQDMHLPIAAG